MPAPVIRQRANIILPTAGTGTETIADTSEHASTEFEAWQLQEKQVNILGVLAGAAGHLLAWVEVSSTGVAGTWVRVGTPSVLAATGSLLLAWTMHSEYARVVLQAPVWTAGSWVVAVYFEGKL